MAFVTGTANSLTDLLTALQNACTANGWTLAGSVLYKGTCYIEVKISGTTINVQGGTGIDGSNNLTGRSDRTAGVSCVNITAIDASPAVPFAFPVTYFVHVNASPDEVYFIAFYATNCYQMMAFGQSAMPGLAGSGNWYSGFTSPGWASGVSGFDTFATAKTYNETRPSLFSDARYSGTACGVDHELDSVTWAVEGSFRDYGALFQNSPSEWNNESILIPVRAYASRLSGFVSPVVECAHARFVNIANLGDQQIITLGTDKWKVYPWWRRGLASNSIFEPDTGLCGHAIRYDGP